MKAEAFFNLLKDRTKEAFYSAPIRLKQIDEGSEWNFSICETPIQIKKGIIAGLNWGVEKGKKYTIQKEYPKIDKDERTWPFVSSTRKYFKEYLKINSVNDINYTNICFFRSPDISYLTTKDWELAIPLFKAYVKHIKPPWILLIGNTGMDHMASDLEEVKQITIKGEKKRIIGYKAILFGEYYLRCLPHPNSYRFYSSNDVNKIWKAVCR